MRFKSVQDVTKYFDDNREHFPSVVHEAIAFLTPAEGNAGLSDYIGKRLNDGYCQGYFGNRFDLYNATILKCNENLVKVKLESGNLAVAHFKNLDLEEVESLVMEWISPELD